MTDAQDPDAPQTAAEKLAAVLARKKDAAGLGAAAGLPGGRKGSERAAAARSASKSKPAMRK